jgi:selenophosphate synthase
VAAHTTFDDAIEEADRLVLADVQTSGGMLIAVVRDKEAALLRDLEARGTLAAVTIGEVIAGNPGALQIVAG